MGMKLSIKHPKAQFFWTLPLLAALGHDIIVAVTTGNGFHFSEIGYLITHYTHAETDIIAAIDSPLWLRFLKILFVTKTVIPTGIIALVAFIWLNRPPRSDYGPSSKGLSKKQRNR